MKPSTETLIEKISMASDHRTKHRTMIAPMT
jgi:hypothetical protein